MRVTAWLAASLLLAGCLEIKRQQTGGGEDVVVDVDAASDAAGDTSGDADAEGDGGGPLECPGGCSDGDPCTLDECIDGKCVSHEAPVATCSFWQDCEELFGPPESVCMNWSCSECGSCSQVPVFDCEDKCTGKVCPSTSNPCEVATCDPETGECSFQAAPDGTPCGDCSQCAGGTCGLKSGAECQDPADCGVAPVCTEAVCEICECKFDKIAGCGTECTAHADCDDKDPCTADVCDLTDGCAHVALSECDAACSSADVTTVQKVLLDQAGMDAKLSAVTTSEQLGNCDGVCSPGVCCGDCPNCKLAVSDETATVNVKPAGINALPYPCQYSISCFAIVESSPFYRDTGYWLWGSLDVDLAFAVDGFCLRTDPSGLSGGTFTVEVLDEPQSGDAGTATFEFIQGTGWTVSLPPELFPGEAQVEAIGDGELVLSVATPQGEARIHLHSTGNQLRGVAIAPPTAGSQVRQVTFTRQPPPPLVQPPGG